ncbi:MAG: hypothetical protein JWM80_6039 [Cyanobacteria bacterium RYN_339]|nr:hypothetical protein [Cyanobacteria bacterium RYN_339]
MFRCTAAATALAILLAGAPAFAEPVDITILHTNDTHDHLESFDTKNGKELGGVARRKTLIDQIRHAVKNVLVLDGGDVFQGTPLYTFFNGEPDYKAIRLIGYDGLTVGNHDLDNGLDNLEKQALLLANPPLALNLVRENGAQIFPGYRVIDRAGLKIALVGIMSQNAFDAVAGERRKGLKLEDPIKALQGVVPALREKCDLVVILSHSGHEEEVEIAKAVPGIDVIVGGHSHSKVDHPVVVLHGDRPTLVVQAFQWGEFLGRIDLTVDHQKITKFEGHLVPVESSLKPDAGVEAMLAPYVNKIKAQMDEVVGHTAVEFLNQNKQNGDAPIGNLIADAIRERTGTDVAFMNSGGIRAPFPKGAITRGMVYSCLPFENRLVKFEVSGELMAQILEFVAGKTGKQGSLQISGLTLTVENGKPKDVMIGGQPFDRARNYTISTIDYIANGNDGADVFKQVKELHPTGELVRDAMFAYMAAHALVDTPEGGRIKLLSPVN